MSDLSTNQAVVNQRQWMLALILQVLAEAVALFRRGGGWCMRMMSAGAVHARSAASRTGAAIAAIRLPVSPAAHSRVLRQLERFEAQAIASVRSIECRQKRARAFISLARTAYEVGRDNTTFLKAALVELEMEHYWQRKQVRIFSAAQLACAAAGLAARSGHADIARDAYLCGQGYNGKVVDVDRKIGMATAFADVAALLEAPYDRVAWLAGAMELASGIPEAEKRLGAVNFVARKMVLDQVPPCDNHLTDKRFEVDISAMAPLPVTEIAKKPAAADPGCEEIKFDL